VDSQSNQGGEEAVVTVLITLCEPTGPALTKAAPAAFYDSKDFPTQYPRRQTLTMAGLLEGKRIQYPEHCVETFARAERKTKHSQDGLF
jgi:hypothetical protein